MSYIVPALSDVIKRRYIDPLVDRAIDEGIDQVVRWVHPKRQKTGHAMDVDDPQAYAAEVQRIGQVAREVNGVGRLYAMYRKRGGNATPYQRREARRLGRALGAIRTFPRWKRWQRAQRRYWRNINNPYYHQPRSRTRFTKWKLRRARNGSIYKVSYTPFFP